MIYIMLVFNLYKGGLRFVESAGSISPTFFLFDGCTFTVNFPRKGRRGDVETNDLEMARSMFLITAPRIVIMLRINHICRLNSEKPSFFLENFFGMKIHQQNQKITLNLMM